MNEQDALWRRRFHLFAALRVAGLLLFLGGLAIAVGDWPREGGWPIVGLPLALIGLVDAVIAPKILRRGWERMDR